MRLNAAKAAMGIREFFSLQFTVYSLRFTDDYIERIDIGGGDCTDLFYASRGTRHSAYKQIICKL